MIRSLLAKGSIRIFIKYIELTITSIDHNKQYSKFLKQIFDIKFGLHS